MSDWWETAGGARACTRRNPVNPQRVAWELSPRLPDDVIVTCDSGSCANWYARDLRMRRGQMCSLSGGLASMGAAVPYAIGAKFAHPGPAGDRAGRRRRHADEQHGRADHRREILASAGATSGWICCVFNNEDLNQVTWEQRVMEGYPQVRGDPGHPRCPLPPLRRADRPERHLSSTIRSDLGAAWDEALAADRPVVLEVKTDPEVPPLPPHISFEQARKFMLSMTKDDDAAHVIKDTARQVINAVLHREEAD